MTSLLPLVTAHSGCEDTPENSLESMLAGIAAGADTVEIDVRATGDGTPILMHDPFVGRGGTDIAVQQLSINELDAIATLEQALDLVASYDVMVDLDLKDDGCIEGVVRLVRSHGLGEKVILTGCTPARARVLRTLAPELPVLLNAEVPTGPIATDAYTRFVKHTCRTAIEHHCCGINVHFDGCREELVTHGRRRYLPVSVWTVDDDRDMHEMVRLGVHSITTHHPRQLISLLGPGREATGSVSRS